MTQMRLARGVFDILAEATDGAAAGADHGEKSGCQQQESETFHRCVHRFVSGVLALVVLGGLIEGRAAQAFRRQVRRGIP